MVATNGKLRNMISAQITICHCTMLAQIEGLNLRTRIAGFAYQPRDGLRVRRFAERPDVAQSPPAFGRHQHASLNLPLCPRPFRRMPVRRAPSVTHVRVK